MNLNHVSHRVAADHFEAVVEMFRTQLGFVALRRTTGAIWMRQPGANVDIQLTRSVTASRDDDKRGSQISFLSPSPRADLEKLADWARRNGFDPVIGSWSDREFFLDLPAAFVDFVIEAMTPDMADYGR